ncbi:MAG TPA: hypothetical protein VD838_00970 [Anaeromyxobacteraceae bacterium]|nr:hypothetical protein [Anaeromyxobacteraceae bacterium]
MTRPLSEIELEAELNRKRRASFDRLLRGGLTSDEERLERENFAAISAELGALKDKAAPPPAQPLLDLSKVAPSEAAKRAATIAADPRFWDPRKADAEGKRLSADEHARLVQERSELIARAAETPEE